MRARRRCLVEVEGLRIEARCECLDRIGSEGVAPEIADLADADILEKLHCSLAAIGSAGAALAARRPNIGLTVRAITAWSAALISSSRNLTNPMSGRLREPRVSSTVARALIRSPGRIGASHCTSSTPGAPMKLVSAMRVSLSMRMRTQQLCQPDATTPPT